jgi:hypothetical protein
MSAAKVAASLRSTGWTGTFGSSPSKYSEMRHHCAIFQRISLLPGHRKLDRLLSAEQLARQRDHEGLKWVEP